MKHLLIIFTFIISFNSFSQEELEDFFLYTKKGEYEKAMLVLNTFSDITLKRELQEYLGIVSKGIFDFNQNVFKHTNDSTSTAFNVELINNALHKYIKEGKEVEAYELLKKSINLAKEKNDSLMVCLSIQYVLEIYERFHIAIGDNSYTYFIKEYQKYAYNDFEKNLSRLYDYRVRQRSLKNYSSEYFYSIKEQLEHLRSPAFEAKRDLTHLTHYRLLDRKNYDSAKFYLNRTFKTLEKEHLGYFEKERLEATKITKAILELESGKPKKSLETLKSVKILKEDYVYKLLEKFVFSYKSQAYKAIGDEQKHLVFNNKYLRAEIEAEQAKNKLKVSNQETEYQTIEKEKKIVQLLNTNLKTEAREKRNRNLLIGSISLFIFGFIIAFLIYKNTKRKQRIAEQEREIEIQKTEKLLKEQELTAIDAMISGQEKERQRLANDLHDNLGSTLATVKLHFDHLQHNRDNPKVENIEELFTKTNNLLEEAYQKVRTIAHEKNSGVMAKQGLLPAIKNLAKKASNSDGLQIEVQDYGLDERLDNTLEISIFRIIQELITNTIKHANATEIHISLTNHDSLLNIIVEDNGKGFQAKILPEKDGMGLKSIEKRIEHMEGTFEIDSTVGKGTNIIINIPI
ncbi:sensor histidine kinase [Aquimarina sp. 2201CG14-23]|uniref:sensor histidine kinase n=1 Tax=Aquimarina mycalae TaxID=3040073 RepID=UPI002477EFB1|nr:sensor histidine kinase [Aquimarina sp. 2201CG14-23]MDH7444480.1 sensor histidine kinase [Aquimarina sp. 2201CG14-23]